LLFDFFGAAGYSFDAFYSGFSFDVVKILSGLALDTVSPLRNIAEFFNVVHPPRKRNSFDFNTSNPKRFSMNPMALYVIELPVAGLIPNDEWFTLKNLTSKDEAVWYAAHRYSNKVSIPPATKLLPGATAAISVLDTEEIINVFVFSGIDGGEFEFTLLQKETAPCLSAIPEITASSEYDDHYHSKNINDRNLSTGWLPEAVLAGDSQWVQYDLGSVYSLKRAVCCRVL
jgi:hypothetical protein